MIIFAQTKRTMAILHRKEEKIQVVLGRLDENYTTEQFVEMFIKLYSKEWGKIKSAYVKQSQDKEPGTVVTMPKPALYLAQLLEKYLAENKTAKVETETVKEEVTEVKEKAKKTSVAKKATAKKVVEPEVVKEKATKTPVAKKAVSKKAPETEEVKEKTIKATATKKASVKKDVVAKEEKVSKKATTVKK